MTDVQCQMQMKHLDIARRALEAALRHEPEHPHIPGIGRGRNMRRWWIEQAGERVQRARGVEG